MNENQTPDVATKSSRPWLSKKRRVLLACVVGLIGLNMLSNYLGTPTVRNRLGLYPVTEFEGEFPYQDAEVRFYTRFVSGNPLCSPDSFIGTFLSHHFISDVIGLDPAYVVAPVEVKRGEGNRFSGRVYMDHFNSGWCGWRWSEELLFDVRPHAATEMPPLAEWPMPNAHTTKTWLRRNEKVQVKCFYPKSQVFGCAATRGANRGDYGKPAFLEFKVYPRNEAAK